MKGLHKKIGVGVLVSGLLIGGVSFQSGSISYANSNNNEASLFLELGSVLSGFGLEIPEILKIFEKEGFRGMLDYDYRKSNLPLVLSQFGNMDQKDIYPSIFNFGKSGKYAVLGFDLNNKKYCINENYNKYWSSPLKKFNFNFKDFRNLSQGRFDNREDKFKKAGLESGFIYKVRIDNQYDFLIFVFNKDGNV